MTRKHIEKNNRLTNWRATVAALGLLGGMLSIAHIIGLKNDEKDLADHRTYTARHAAELALLQHQLDAQTPKHYTSKGKRLVPQARFEAHYSQLDMPASSIEASRKAHARDSTLFGSLGGILLATAAAGSLLTRRRRLADEQYTRTVKMLRADTQVLAYVPATPIADRETSAVYGAPPSHRTVRERRLTQRQAPVQYDPFATPLNHDIPGLDAGSVATTAPYVYNVA